MSDSDSGASADQCNLFRTNHPACAACILTPASASRLGPIVELGGLATANVAGCIELADPGGLMCAKALQAFAGCQLAACQANCPVSDPTTRSAYDNCALTVEANGLRLVYGGSRSVRERRGGCGGEHLLFAELFGLLQGGRSALLRFTAGGRRKPRRRDADAWGRVERRA